MGETILKFKSTSYLESQELQKTFNLLKEKGFKKLECSLHSTIPILHSLRINGNVEDFNKLIIYEKIIYGDNFFSATHFFAATFS